LKSNFNTADIKLFKTLPFNPNTNSGTKQSRHIAGLVLTFVSALKN